MKKRDNAIVEIANMTFAVIIVITIRSCVKYRRACECKISDFVRGYPMRSLMIKPIKKYEILDHDSIH